MSMLSCGFSIHLESLLGKPLFWGKNVLME